MAVDYSNSYLFVGIKEFQGLPYRTVSVFRPGLGTVRYRCTERYTLIYRVILYFLYCNSAAV